MPAFAKHFVAARMAGFTKDMRICFTGVPAEHRKGDTHAYFPALAACCATLEYLTALSLGARRAFRDGLTKNDIATFAQEHMHPHEYDQEVVRILWLLFRNAVAHRGITTGVWVDNHVNHQGRRLGWRIGVSSGRPAIEVVPMARTITKDAPWPCATTHIANVRLGQLARDIRGAARRLSANIEADPAAATRFHQAMTHLYPA
jgi:hypothetical protein